jgi:phospholipase C
MRKSAPRQAARRWLGLGTAAILVAGLVSAGTQVITSGTAGAAPTAAAADRATTTPIKHVVVIFDENVSFDHYFGTYPYAANTDGTPFTPAADTPKRIETALNAGLLPGDQLAAHNPNGDLDPAAKLYTGPNPNAFQPKRLSSSQAMTCDQNHSYGPEQSAINGGKMDNFAATSSAASCATGGLFGVAGLAMHYYDGNTVTGLWNYAQNYAMSDNYWDTVFGPSTPGALNLVSGNTYSGTAVINGDPDPNGDAFGTQSAVTTPSMYGANVGDLLNDKGVSWGWFQGGFNDRNAQTANVGGAASEDYSPHHAPFQYYASTANSAHTAPADGSEIGHDGAANHQYDLSAFHHALAGPELDGAVPELPAVSFLKAPQAQDGHAGYSDPTDEQQFLTTEINTIQQSPEWASTAIVVTYDDSDGWYDHVAPTITNSSTGASGDAKICTTAASYGVPQLGGYAGRCGPSQRVPLVVISPYAKKNYVSHDLTNQASVLKFIEDNWSTGTIDPISAVKGSFDAGSASLDDMFDWTHPQLNQVLLDSTMYQPGVTTCAGLSDYSTCISPTFGSVTGTPASPTVPVPAPVIGVAHHTVTIPAGADVPDGSAFLTEAGATISQGALAVDLTSIDAEAVGSYPVTVTGADGDIPSMNPQVVTVKVVPVVAVAHPSVTVTAGTTLSPSYVRSLAGASIRGGVLDLPDLSPVDFSTPGSYQIEITGAGNGVSATPVPVIVLVVHPDGAPMISLHKSALAYPVGGAPSPAAVAVAAGAAISHGELDPISLAGVDFGTPGSYLVSVTGGDAQQAAAPATLSITVVAAPVITVAKASIAVPAGTKLTSPLVLALARASISSGTLAALDLARVDTKKAGSYGVSVTGSDRGIAAAPVNLVIQVQAAPVRPVASRAVLRIAPHRVRAPKRVAVTVALTAPGARAGTVIGKVVIYDRARVLKTILVRAGKAKTTLKLARGKHRIHATYLGNRASSPAVTGSHTTTIVVTVTKARR